MLPIPQQPLVEGGSGANDTRLACRQPMVDSSQHLEWVQDCLVKLRVEVRSVLLPPRGRLNYLVIATETWLGLACHNISVLERLDGSSLTVEVYYFPLDGLQCVEVIYQVLHEVRRSIL